jgi:hypothetical protein
MGVSFISGKFPIMISGSWWYGRLQAEIKDFEWGTFLFPGSTMTLGSGGNLWVVLAQFRLHELQAAPVQRLGAVFVGHMPADEVQDCRLVHDPLAARHQVQLFSTEYREVASWYYRLAFPMA